MKIDNTKKVFAGTSSVDDYIVRIYRHSPDTLVGVVENPACEERCFLFQNFKELESILTHETQTAIRGVEVTTAMHRFISNVLI